MAGQGIVFSPDPGETKNIRLCKNECIKSNGEEGFKTKVEKIFDQIFSIKFLIFTFKWSISELSPEDWNQN